MPDFTVRAAATVPPGGVATVAWEDPPTESTPTRLNVRADVQHRYTRVLIAEDSELQLELRAVVGGVEAPADAALGGRLFSWSHSLEPVGAPIPVIVSPVGGKTSVARVPLSAAYPGHYRVACSRPGSGHLGIPFDVEVDPT